MASNYGFIWFSIGQIPLCSLCTFTHYHCFSNVQRECFVLILGFYQQTDVWVCLELFSHSFSPSLSFFFLSLYLYDDCFMYEWQALFYISACAKFILVLDSMCEHYPISIVQIKYTNQCVILEGFQYYSQFA